MKGLQPPGPGPSDKYSPATRNIQTLKYETDGRSLQDEIFQNVSRW